MLGIGQSGVGTQAPACVVCGGMLTGKQSRYCSEECTKAEKRRRTGQAARQQITLASARRAVRK